MISNYIAIGLRLVSILFFIEAIEGFLFIFEYYQLDSQQQAALSFWRMTSSGLMYWILAFGFWFFSRGISQVITRGLEGEVTSEPPLSILTVFVVSIGLFIFVNAAIDIVFYIAQVVTYGEAADIWLQMIGQNVKASMIATAIKAAVGLFLVLKARTISQYINRVST